MLAQTEEQLNRLAWTWDKSRLRGAKLKQGAYLLRTHLDPMEPAALWCRCVQLTEVEGAVRALKS